MALGTPLNIMDEDALWRRVSRDKLNRQGQVTLRAYILPKSRRQESDTPDPQVSVYLAKIANKDQVALNPRGGAPGTWRINCGRGYECVSTIYGYTLTE